VSTRTTCRHCGQIILRRSSDGLWFNNVRGFVTSDCEQSQDGKHAAIAIETDDRITSAFGHALVGAMRAEAILNQGHEHAASKRTELAKAAASLNAYLAELER
jgi:hypothetical protein